MMRPLLYCHAADPGLRPRTLCPLPPLLLPLCSTPALSRSLHASRRLPHYIEHVPPTAQPLARPAPVFLTNPAIFPPTLVSIGPNTDAVLDRFKMNDDVLPRLRTLSSTVHSSRWEAVLRSHQWNLPYEQAANLSRALNADTQGSMGTRFEKVSKNIYTAFLASF